MIWHCCFFFGDGYMGGCFFVFVVVSSSNFGSIDLGRFLLFKSCVKLASSSRYFAVLISGQVTCQGN